MLNDFSKRAIFWSKRLIQFSLIFYFASQFGELYINGGLVVLAVLCVHFYISLKHPPDYGEAFSKEMPLFFIIALICGAINYLMRDIDEMAALRLSSLIFGGVIASFIIGGVFEFIIESFLQKLIKKK